MKNNEPNIDTITPTNKPVVSNFKNHGADFESTKGFVNHWTQSNTFILFRPDE